MAQQFPLELTVKVPGARDLSVMLSRYRDGITDFTPFWNDYFVPTWYSLMARQYSSEGGITGAQWAPLTAKYAAWKQRHFPGQPVGVLTGAARASLTSPNDSHTVLTVSKDKFAVGTDLNYPIYLQVGTRKMVARPPMRVDKLFMTDIGKLLQKFAYDVAKKVKP